ncbi:hypothetical protein ERIC1_1c33460 [Paenibacillus larvae subsp. larvae DSM 25719]|nr:hypothetical protein ERIC1_1c33460 [Paenibacillus larvae subsp. larvae DSM 25719]
MGQKRFPPDVEEFIHRLCVEAIFRAIKNGTYKYPNQKVVQK